MAASKKPAKSAVKKATKKPVKKAAAKPAKKAAKSARVKSKAARPAPSKQSPAKKAPAKKAPAKKPAAAAPLRKAKPANNKTQAGAGSVATFLDTLPDVAQRADGKALLAMFERASGEPGVMWGSSIVGCGRHHYRYESGREGDTMIVGFSPRKGQFALYLGLGGDLGVGDLLTKLGKHDMGKGCLYVKRLADVDTAVLERIVDAAVRSRRARTAT